MGLFRKRKPDFVDLTKLKKSGVLRRSKSIEKRATSFETRENDVVDLSNMNSESAVKSDSIGFLGGLASANSDSDSVIGKLKETRQNRGEVEHLKVKIDDLEYKIDRFLERLSKIEEKLGD
jgi:seryl-tRNA synthetase